MSTSGWCTVQGCPGRQYDFYFKFPGDEALCEEWLKLVKSPKSKKPVLLGLSSRICSLHFTDDDYDKEVEPEGLTLERLKATAIPSIFPWTESWPLNKKKKKVEEGTNDKKKADAKKAEQTFACPTCDYTTNRAVNWESHRRGHEGKHRHSCDQCNFSTDRLDRLDVHLSRDHSGSATEAGASAGPQERARSSTSTAEAAIRKSVRLEARGKKGYQKESGSSGSRTGPNVLDSDDSSADDSSSDESTGGTRSTSSSDANNLKSASSTKLSKSHETQLDDTIQTGTSQKDSEEKGTNLDPSCAVQREVDQTPIVLDSSSSDQDADKNAIEVSETVVKKEVETSGGKKKKRKIIWVVSGTADE